MAWKALCKYRFDITGKQDLTISNTPIELKDGAKLSPEGLVLDGQGAYAKLPLNSVMFPELMIKITFRPESADTVSFSPLVMVPDVFWNYLAKSQLCAALQLQGSAMFPPNSCELVAGQWYSVVVRVFQKTIAAEINGKAWKVSGFTSNIPTNSQKGVFVGWSDNEKDPTLAATIRELTLLRYEHGVILDYDKVESTSDEERENWHHGLDTTKRDPDARDYIRRAWRDTMNGARQMPAYGEFGIGARHRLAIIKGMRKQEVTDEFEQAVAVALDALFRTGDRTYQYSLARKIADDVPPPAIRDAANVTAATFGAFRYFEHQLRKKADEVLSKGGDL